MERWTRCSTQVPARPCFVSNAFGLKQLHASRHARYTLSFTQAATNINVPKMRAIKTSWIQFFWPRPWLQEAVLEGLQLCKNMILGQTSGLCASWLNPERVLRSLGGSEGLPLQPASLLRLLPSCKITVAQTRMVKNSIQSLPTSQLPHQFHIDFIRSRNGFMMFHAAAPASC